MGKGFDGHKNNDISHLSNMRWLTLFYCLPKEFLQKYSEYMAIPRCPNAALEMNWNSGFVGSKQFADIIKKIYSEAMWKHIKIPQKDKYVKMDSPMSDFSENFALWQLVNNATSFVQAILEETKYSMPKLASMPEDSEIPWMSEADFDKLMEYITARIVQEQGWQPTIDFVWQNRTPEDYSAKNSRKKIDTYRKWNHSRTEVGANMVSYDAAQEQATENGTSFDIPDEAADPADVFDKAENYNPDAEAREYQGSAVDGEYDEWLANDIREIRRDISEYMDMLKSEFGYALCHEDRQLLALRNEEYTHKEIAEIQKFGSHTGVVNRLKHIEERYEAKQRTSPRRKKLVSDDVQIHQAKRQLTIYLGQKRWYWHVYLCSPKAFTLCKHCLKKIGAGKHDFCCPAYRKNGICAASDLSYIYYLHCRPRKRREHEVKDIKCFLPPPTEWWRS